MRLVILAAALLVQAQGAEPLRRLTHSQYNNAVRDLLGDQTRPADRFPPEDFINGFRNQAQGQASLPCSRKATARPPSASPATHSAAAATPTSWSPASLLPHPTAPAPESSSPGSDAAPIAAPRRRRKRTGS